MPVFHDIDILEEYRSVVLCSSWGLYGVFLHILAGILLKRCPSWHTMLGHLTHSCWIIGDVNFDPLVGAVLNWLSLIYLF